MATLEAELLQTDVTNGFSWISFDVAHHFISTGYPTEEQLELIFAATEPKLYAMRIEMKLRPMSFMDLGDLISILRKVQEDEPEKFSIR